MADPLSRERLRWETKHLIGVVHWRFVIDLTCLGGLFFYFKSHDILLVEKFSLKMFCSQYKRLHSIWKFVKSFTTCCDMSNKPAKRINPLYSELEIQMNVWFTEFQHYSQLAYQSFLSKGKRERERASEPLLTSLYFCSPQAHSFASSLARFSRELGKEPTNSRL